MKLLVHDTDFRLLQKIFLSQTNGVDGYTDFADFHEIFTDFESQIRKNLVEIREIRTSINPPHKICPRLKNSLLHILFFLKH